MIGDPPSDPPWYSNRLLLRFGAVVLGVVAAYVVPQIKQLWHRSDPCAVLFPADEIEALLGVKADLRGVLALSDDHSCTCEAGFAWGEYEGEFEVEFDAAFGTSTAFHGFKDRMKWLAGREELIGIEPVPELGPDAYLADLGDDTHGHRLTVLLKRPKGGSIEITAHAPGPLKPDAKAKLLTAVQRHLPEAEKFFVR